MFFGLTNFPTTFQTIVNTMFWPHVQGKYFTIYMYNSVIHTYQLPYKTEEEHLARHHKYVHTIFNILEENNLYPSLRSASLNNGKSTTWE